MRILNLFVFAVLLSQGTYDKNSKTEGSRTWVPARYQGIVVGTSTKAEVLNVLGKPKSVGKEEDTGIPILSFEVSDPVRGVLTAYMRDGLLESMSLSPKGTLTKKRIIQILGSGYLTVHYSTDDCLGEGGAAPVYEDPDGPIERVEYRSRGVAVSLHDDDVEAILFVAKPFGPTHSRCSRPEKKKK